MNRDPVFDEEEIRQLLQRAAELQAASVDDPSGPGLTLQEVEQAAESAGLNPSYVRQAARELSGPKTTHASTDVTDTHLFVERRIDRPMSDDAWQTMVSELHHRKGAPRGWSLSTPFEWSTTEEIGDTREWIHHRLGSSHELRVSLSPHGDQMRLRLAQRTSTGGSPTMIALTLGLVLATVTAPLVGVGLESWTWAIASGILLFASGTPAVYAGIKAWRRSQLRSLETLADHLEEAVKDARSATPASVSTAQADRSTMDQRRDGKSESADLSSSSEPNQRAHRRQRGRS